MKEDIELSFDTNIIIALFIVLLILKLVGWISWSWWWIFSPLWIPTVISIIAVIVNKIAFLLRKDGNM